MDAALLRDAIPDDIESIRRWRDHPRVRATSIFTGRITPEGHARWWAAVQADPAKLVLVFEDEGTPAGVVTFNDIDTDARSAEWGFFLDVDGLDARGRLLQAWIRLEGEAIDYAFDRLGLERIGGRNLGRNRPVLDLHRRFGFLEVPERGYVADVDGVPEPITWTELHVSERRTRPPSG